MWLKWHKLKTREEESSRSQVRCIERISLLQPILGTRRIRVPRLREESEKESRDVTACGLRVGYEYRNVTACGLRVGYEYRDVTACGLRIQRRTETSLPVGYEYRDVTAFGLRIQRRHCLWVTNTETSLPVRFAHRRHCQFLSVLTLVLKRTKKTLCWKMTYGK